MDSSQSSFAFLSIIPIILSFVFIVSIFGFIIHNIIKGAKAQKQKMHRISVQYPDIVRKYYDLIMSNPVLNEKREQIVKDSKAGKTLLIFGFILFFLLPPVGIVLIILGLIKTNSKRQEYEKAYKLSIMKSALKEFDETFSYYPTGSIPEPMYKEAKFEHYDRYFSEDRINGTIDGYDFIMADVHVQDKREDSDGDTHYVTMFNGPVAIVNLPDYIDLDLSIASNGLRLFSGHRVEIDNPEFEELYNVYSSDQVTTMRVLTPAITTKLIDLYNKYEYVFEVKIIGNKLYFRFHSGNMFQPNPTKPEEEAIGIALYFEILNGIKEIMVEIMNATKFLRKKSR